MSRVLSATYTNEGIKKSSCMCIRKLVIDDSEDELMDKTVREEVSHSEDSDDQNQKRHMSKIAYSRSRHRLATFSLRPLLGSGVQSKLDITCLLCNRKIACSDARSTLLAYYICDDCVDSEKGHVEELEAALLASNSSNASLRAGPIGCASDSTSGYNHCKCQSCIQQQLLDEERREELKMLQSCWHELRQNIRQMFRDGLNANMTSSKGKRFDVDKIKRNVAVLAKKDPHQLYKRLESIGHEYVMNLKSDDLWQILVAPQVVPSLIQLYEAGVSEEHMELERAKLFIKTLLDRFSYQQETARNMSPLLAALDKEYLAQFGVSWKVVNHHIFDRVIYQDDLLLNYLPSLENALKCELVVDDENEEESLQRACTEAARTDIPQGALELAQSFRVFHKLMITSRELFRKASANIALYIEQQKVISHIARKAEGDLLKGDPEFFKKQRKIVRNCTLQKNQCYQWHADFNDLLNEGSDNSDSADEVDISKRLHELIEEGPAISVCIDENGEVLPCVRCKKCSLRHCSCDECRISHIITCGLLIDAEDINNLIWPVSDGSDRDVGSDSERPERKNSSLARISRLSSRSLRFQAARALFTLHDHHSKKETAWGDWEVPYVYSSDLDYLDHYLCRKNGMQKDLVSSDNRRDKDDEHAADSSDAVEVSSSGADRKITKKSRRRKMESRSSCQCESDNMRRASSVSDSYVTKEIKEDETKQHEQCSSLREQANQCLKEESNYATPSTGKNMKKLRKKAANAALRDGDQTESDHEKSLPQLSDAAEGAHSCHREMLNEVDRKSLKEISRQHSASTAREYTVGDLLVDLCGSEAIEKPQRTLKTELTPPASCSSKKATSSTDKNDTNGGTNLTTKSLSASAGEKLLDEMKDMDGTVRERALLRLIQSCEGELWSASSEEYEAGMLESMKECLAKEWAKENDGDNLGAAAVAAAKDANEAAAQMTANQGSSLVKALLQEEDSREKAGLCSGSKSSRASSATTNKKTKSAGKAELENVTQNWPKQSLAAAITKQLTDRKTIVEISKALKAEKKKAARTGKNGDIDFSIDLGDFDLSSFPEEVRKSYEEGKFTRFLKQAVGLKRNKIGVSAKFGCKCSDGKRARNEFGDTKDESFGYQTDDIEDLTEDDNEGTDEEWSDYEPPEGRHPHHHHSCDNRMKGHRGLFDTHREGRHVHCDCCYCEMFGHDSVKSGRAQIRERLRMKLKLRNVQEQSANHSKTLEGEKSTDVVDNDESKKPPAVVRDAPIEEILDYINEKDNAVAQAAASKAAKRARQKLRKQEERQRLEKMRKLKEEQKKAAEAELLQRKKVQQIAPQVAKKEKEKEKQNKPEGKKKKPDRVRGKKQKDGRERPKEYGSQTLENREEAAEVRKEPILEFEYWNDAKCDPEFRRLASTKEHVNLSKAGRGKTQSKEEAKKTKTAPKRAEVEAKRGNRSVTKEDPVKVSEGFAASKTNAVPEEIGTAGSQNALVAVTSESVSSDFCAQTSETVVRNEKSGTNDQLGVKVTMENGTSDSLRSGTVTETFATVPDAEAISRPPGFTFPKTQRPDSGLPDIPHMRHSEFTCANIPHRLPSPILPVPPPLSKVNSFGVGAYQGGVGYYTHFGGQPQLHLINGLNHCDVLSPNQNVPSLPMANADLLPDSTASRPLRTPPGFKPRICQMGTYELSQTSGRHVPPPAPSNTPLSEMYQRARPISPAPGFDTKAFHTPTNIPLFNCSRVPQHPSEPSSLSSLSSSLSSSSSLKTPFYDNMPAVHPSAVPAHDLNFDSLERNSRTSCGVVMNSSQRNNLNSSNSSSGGVQLFINPFTSGRSVASPDVHTVAIQNYLDAANNRRDIPDGLPTQAQGIINPPNFAQGYRTAISDAAPKLQKLFRPSQNFNSQFLVNQQSAATVNNLGTANSTVQPSMVGTGEALPGSSQLTAAARIKRNETRKAFLSASDSVAGIELEAQKIAAIVKEDGIFHVQNPVIFEPGDPRIAMAIAEMKFDPHETFKPRPDDELEFLDPLELEVEHLKRVLWEEKQITRPRVSLREMRKTEPENEPNAVSHFAPLV